MSKQVFRERECIHREEGANGEFYNGAFYVQALRRLQVDEALQISKKVSSFFWADAPHILVWLCDGCASSLHLRDTPRSLVQGSRPQAWTRFTPGGTSCTLAGANSAGFCDKVSCDEARADR